MVKHQSTLSAAAPLPPGAWRQSAYDAGQAAYQAGRITLEAWHLYDKLVFWAGDRGYCWWSMPRIAEVFRRCVRHVSRWMRELGNAQLIERHRRGHGPAETHITAYQAAGPQQATFFDGAESDRDQTSMSDRSIKEPTLTGGGSDVPAIAVVDRETPTSPVAAPPPPAAVEALRAAGLVDERTIRALARKPVARIRRTIAYVTRCRRAGPGLIAWLLGNDIPIPEEQDGADERLPVAREHHRGGGGASRSARFPDGLGAFHVYGSDPADGG